MSAILSCAILHVTFLFVDLKLPCNEGFACNVYFEFLCMFQMASGVERSGDAQGNCFMVCPP